MTVDREEGHPHAVQALQRAAGRQDRGMLAGLLRASASAKPPTGGEDVLRAGACCPYAAHPVRVTQNIPSRL